MSETETKVLVFKVNEEYYATDIAEVERILGYEETTRLPESPSFIEGVINYAGDILPILSLARRFNLPSNSKSDENKIIVVKQNDFKIGIVVEEVSEVVSIDINKIEDCPVIASSISRRYIKGLIKLDSKIIIFLNFGKILTDDEKKLI